MNNNDAAETGLQQSYVNFDQWLINYRIEVYSRSLPQSVQRQLASQSTSIFNLNCQQNGGENKRQTRFGDARSLEELIHIDYVLVNLMSNNGKKRLIFNIFKSKL